MVCLEFAFVIPYLDVWAVPKLSSDWRVCPQRPSTCFYLVTPIVLRQFLLDHIRPRGYNSLFTNFILSHLETETFIYDSFSLLVTNHFCWPPTGQMPFMPAGCCGVQTQNSCRNPIRAAHLVLFSSSAHCSCDCSCLMHRSCNVN